jgi:G3E family GTPase
VDDGQLAELESDLRGLNSGAPIQRCSFGDVDPAALLDARRGEVGWASTLPPASAAPVFVQQVSLTAASPIDRAAFEAFLGELPPGLLRGKGTLDFGDVSEHVEYDLSGWRRRPLPLGPRGQSSLVLIGRRLKPDVVRAAWRRCFTSPPQGVRSWSCTSRGS